MIFSVKQYCISKTKYLVGNELGGGADGVVYEIKDDPTKVIKFCILYEYPYENLIERYDQIIRVLFYLKEHNLSTYARVYEYSYIDMQSRMTVNGPQNYILYYYVMERLNKISEDEFRVFHSIMCHEDMGKIKDYSEEKARRMLKGLSWGFDFDESRVMFFYCNVRKTKISHGDIHVRNIMKDSNGNFKLVDFDRCHIKEC
jgi:hypothetical protein